MKFQRFCSMRKTGGKACSHAYALAQRAMASSSSDDENAR
jgi:hypothetical protein